MIKVTIRATETRVSERHFMVDPDWFEGVTGCTIEEAIQTPGIIEHIKSTHVEEGRMISQVGHSNYENHDEEAYIKEHDESPFESFAGMVAEDQHRAAMRIAGDHESDN